MMLQVWCMHGPCCCCSTGLLLLQAVVVMMSNAAAVAVAFVLTMHPCARAWPLLPLLLYWVHLRLRVRAKRMSSHCR